MAFDADDYAALRKDIGVDASVFDNDAADDVLTEGETKYPSNADAASTYARVRALEQLWAESVEEDADYVQNEESEKIGARTPKRKELLDDWRAKLDEILADAEIPKGQRPAFFALAKAGRRWYPVALLVVMWGAERWL
jgi:hypothetical protein